MDLKQQNEYQRRYIQNKALVEYGHIERLWPEVQEGQRDFVAVLFEAGLLEADTAKQIRKDVNDYLGAMNDASAATQPLNTPDLSNSDNVPTIKVRNTQPDSGPAIRAATPKPGSGHHQGNLATSSDDDILTRRNHNIERRRRDSDSSSVPVNVPSNIADKFQHYRILKELGRGGMSIVYRAQHLQNQQYVALKVLLPEGFWGSGFERFKREAGSIRKLNHPNIVRLFDTQFEGETVFLAMQYIDGSSISDLLELKGKMDLIESLEIAEKVADALVHAHQASVIHRDLKPANVLIQANNEPVIVDFGIAKDLDSASLSTQNFGKILGTPGFMSPEQANGADITESTDIYSLGALLYAMLGGRPPFEGDSVAKTLNSVINEDPPDLAKFRKSLPASVIELIQKCLAKKPDGRFLSAEKLRDSIQRVLRSLTQTSDPSIEISAESNEQSQEIIDEVEEEDNEPVSKKPLIICALLLVVSLLWGISQTVSKFSLSRSLATVREEQNSLEKDLGDTQKRLQKVQKSRLTDFHKHIDFVRSGIGRNIQSLAIRTKFEDRLLEDLLDIQLKEVEVPAYGQSLALLTLRLFDPLHCDVNLVKRVTPAIERLEKVLSHPALQADTNKRQFIRIRGLTGIIKALHAYLCKSAQASGEIIVKTETDYVLDDEIKKAINRLRRLLSSLLVFDQDLRSHSIFRDQSYPKIPDLSYYLKVKVQPDLTDNYAKNSALAVLIDLIAMRCIAFYPDVKRNDRGIDRLRIFDSCIKKLRAAESDEFPQARDTQVALLPSLMLLASRAKRNDLATNYLRQELSHQRSICSATPHLYKPRLMLVQLLFQNCEFVKSNSEDYVVGLANVDTEMNSLKKSDGQRLSLIIEECFQSARSQHILNKMAKSDGVYKVMASKRGQIYSEALKRLETAGVVSSTLKFKDRRISELRQFHLVTQQIDYLLNEF